MTLIELCGLPGSFSNTLISQLKEPRNKDGLCITDISYFRYTPEWPFSYENLEYRYSTRDYKMSIMMYRVIIDNQLVDCCDLFIRTDMHDEIFWKKLFFSNIYTISYFDYTSRYLSIGWTYLVYIGYDNERNMGILKIYRDVLNILAVIK